MTIIRLAGRLTLFSFFLFLTAAIAVTVRVAERLTTQAIDRTPYARFCFGGAARCLGFRITEFGAVANGPVLFVGNHVSWSDIPILGGAAPLRFLSKAEVGSWPVIGWLATQAGTLFIQRGQGRAGQSRADIAHALRQGQSVLVFPEGTTTAGVTVLPFHRRLLSAAVDADVPIQPVSIGYRRKNRADHLAPFIGDDEFQSHLVRMLKQPAVEVSVMFHPTVQVGPNDDMQDVAANLQRTVAGGLARIHQGQAGPISSSVASLT
ncbi:lysophospholipid acyltransferase family protein [Marinobacter caseinilyticus]|uniref:lysophospholipid acyltransferase family protein n=1 Tax=Marinobacter caseinilyticus TaxID=2692195 RepID=UPI00140C36D1|nr:lysophospholipid acyltransferase family protein [Marinobacter caseinilyticus]